MCNIDMDPGHDKKRVDTASLRDGYNSTCGAHHQDEAHTPLYITENKTREQDRG